MAFNFFGNKKPIVPQPDQTTPQASPNTPPPPNPNPVLEVGKEVTFKDPKTGEFVYQRAMNPDQRKAIMIALQKNGQCATTSIQLLRNYAVLQKAIMENDNNIVITEKEINDSVQKARDDMKIDGRWLLNPNLLILERRDSPTA